MAVTRWFGVISKEEGAGVYSRPAFMATGLAKTSTSQHQKSFLSGRGQGCEIVQCWKVLLVPQAV